MTDSYDSICCFHGSGHLPNKRLLWEITTACNLSCSFCHRTNNIDYGPEIKKIKEILPFLKKVGIKEIIISGGEPLLRNDIYNILELLKKEEFKVDMCTNGTNITSDISTKLSHILSEISVSIDSYVPSKHDSMRGKKGAWYSTISGIQVLQKAGLAVHSISLVNNDSFEDIENNVKFLYEIGILSMSFIGNIPIGTKTNILISEEHQKILRATFKKMRNTYSDIVINTKELIREEGMTSCMAGENIYGLDVNLIFKPCILQRNVVGIDLKKKENLLLDVVEKFKEMRSVLQNTSSGQGFCPGSRLLNGAQNEVE